MLLYGANLFSQQKVFDRGFVLEGHLLHSVLRAIVMSKIPANPAGSEEIDENLKHSVNTY